MKLLKGFTHPLLRSFKVMSHGVLGTTEGQKELAPLSPVEAVVVDPAGFPFIGYRNSCRGAGGASGSIYKWCAAQEALREALFEAAAGSAGSAGSDAMALSRCNELISSHGRASRWTEGLELFQGMAMARMVPDVVTHNACISCVSWRRALKRLRDIVLDATVISYNASQGVLLIIIEILITYNVRYDDIYKELYK